MLYAPSKARGIPNIGWEEVEANAHNHEHEVDGTHKWGKTQSGHHALMCGAQAGATARTMSQINSLDDVRAAATKRSSISWFLQMKRRTAWLDCHLRDAARTWPAT